MWLVEPAIAGAVHITLGHQCAVNGVGIERVEAVVAKNQRLQRNRRHAFPKLLALVHPGTDLMARQAAGEGNLVLPAIELAHLEQKDTERVIAGVLRIRDMAVLLDGADDLAEIEHGKTMYSKPDVYSIRIETLEKG